MKMMLGLAAAIAVLPSGVAAHALDEYVQAARLSLTRSHVGLEFDLTPGAQVAAPVVAMIDSNQDGVIAPDEAAAYAARVLQDTVVELNGERVAMRVIRIEVPSIADMREGIGTIHVSALGVHRARVSGEARLGFRNDHAPEKSVYLVNALVPSDRTLSVVRQERDRFQRTVQIVYDARPDLVVAMGWIVFAVATTLGLVVVRGQEK